MVTKTQHVCKKNGQFSTKTDKTVLAQNENGEWRAQKSEVGSTKTMRYDAQQGGGKNMAIDPHSWYKT